MTLPIITVLTAGTLGGAIAAGITAVVIVAAALLALLAATNGLRVLGGVWSEISPD
jgi:hypothetical protein